MTPWLHTYENCFYTCVDHRRRPTSEIYIREKGHNSQNICNPFAHPLYVHLPFKFVTSPLQSRRCRCPWWRIRIYKLHSSTPAYTVSSPKPICPLISWCASAFRRNASTYVKICLSIQSYFYHPPTPSVDRLIYRCRGVAKQTPCCRLRKYCRIVLQKCKNNGSSKLVRTEFLIGKN